MTPLLSRDQMRAFDGHAISAWRVPSLLLMENAGRGAADAIGTDLFAGATRGKRVVVVAGAGNNGGDGFVVARHLRARGADVEVRLWGDPSKMTDDCKTNHDAFVGIGGRVVLGYDMAALDAALASADVAVDALFGTGLTRPLAPPMSLAVEALGRARAPKVSLDIPSGVDADTGAQLGRAVEATLTVTFGHLKIGLVTGAGARLAGRVRIVDLGVPAHLRDEPAAELCGEGDVRAVLRRRPRDAHKYTAGHVAVVAGSPGKVGASLLAAHAALRAGAGAATIVTWDDAASTLDTRVLEAMTARLRRDGPLEDDVDRAIASKRAVVVGPGFGTDDAARRAIARVLARYEGPVVLDADALTIHRGALEAIAGARGSVILTPHAGELARLLDVTSADIEADRVTAARRAAEKANAVVLLKGAGTLIAAPGGRVVVNASGNAALATAGAGDVLAGIAGALACGLEAFEATFSAAYVHGAAADVWSRAVGREGEMSRDGSWGPSADRGLLAHEIADRVPSVLAQLLETEAR